MHRDTRDIREIATEEIETIFSLDVSRVQTARYVVRRSKELPGLLLHREDLAAPACTPTWGKKECRSRLELWRKNLQEGARMWGAYANAALAGFILTSPLLSDKTVEVYSLFVDGSRRRTGVGSALLHLAEQDARGISAVALHLTTTLTNAVAIDFYLCNGYQVVQLTDRGVVRDQHPEIRLAKRLE